jgi:hypothetical protein
MSRCETGVRCIVGHKLLDTESRCVCDMQHRARSRINLACDSFLNLGPVANGGFFLAACRRLDTLPSAPIFGKVPLQSGIAIPRFFRLASDADAFVRTASMAARSRQVSSTAAQ